MSLVNFDTDQSPLLRAPTLTRQGTEKHLTHAGTKILGGKSRGLRLDSPTTIEACKELGVLVEDLKQKTIEDFRDPRVDDDVISLRFAHYQKRFNQNQADVIARKKQIMKARNKAQRHNEYNNPGHTTDRLKITTDTLLPPLNQTGANSMKHSSSVPHMIPPEMWETYNRTMGYLKAAHEMPGTREPEEVIDIEGRGTFQLTETSALDFDIALGQEVNRFNKLKRQKQKEARDAFENELRRVRTAQELKEKAIRLQEREKKLIVDRKKAEEEKKKKAEDKLEQIRDMDRRYNDLKAEEKERQRKKLEETKKKLAGEAEERKRHIIEHEEKMEQKRKEAEEKRERLKIEEQERSDRLMIEIDSKLYGSQDRHLQILSEKSSRVKVRLLEIEDQAKKMKDFRIKNEDDSVQALVGKLVKKEEAIVAFQDQQLKELKKREQELKEKAKRFDGNTSAIHRAQRDRMNEINDRFQKVQENLAVKRAQEEKSLKLKQETTRLRILDKQENFNKKQRQISHQRQKVLDKEKEDYEKLIQLKHQRQILQQAKMETTIQSKIERDRIEDRLQQLSKLVKDTTSAKNLNELQKKLLKEIFAPEDFKKLEDEERRFKEEQLAILEAQKNGLPIHTGKNRQ